MRARITTSSPGYFIKISGAGSQIDGLAPVLRLGRRLNPVWELMDAGCQALPLSEPSQLQAMPSGTCSIQRVPMLV